jgi:hypothetical protein
MEFYPARTPFAKKQEQIFRSIGARDVHANDCCGYTNTNNAVTFTRSNHGISSPIRGRF